MRQPLAVSSIVAAAVLAASAIGRVQAPTRPAEATSLLGKPLHSAEPAADERARLDENLARARADLEKAPRSEEAIVWLGRRTAYLGRYREAIDIYSKGLEIHPSSAKLYRHRGHRYLTVREIDRAVADFEKAAALADGKPDEIEPDGIPNARNTPTSTLKTNIYYHLGLARYVTGDFPSARRAYETCLAWSKNDDMLAATTHWLYMTLRRLGDEAAAARVLAPIRVDMDIIENRAYHDLLLMYKGVRTPESITSASPDALTSATVGYGVGNWHLYNGDTPRATAIFQGIVDGPQWPAFGHLAAEAELARKTLRPGRAEALRHD
jgi:tetratricopeptide (TPR) repeat protein